MTRSRLYYEAHITIDPVQGLRRYDLDALVRPMGFRLANLVMMKDGTEHNEDAFMTARHVDLKTISTMTKECVNRLLDRGHKVRRWKIEDTILDSRSGDTLEMLG